MNKVVSPACFRNLFSVVNGPADVERQNPVKALLHEAPLIIRARDISIPSRGFCPMLGLGRVLETASERDAMKTPEAMTLGTSGQQAPDDMPLS